MHVQAFKEVLAIAKQTPFFLPDCVNTTFCYPYITDLDVQTIMALNLGGAPDFPAILDGIYAALNGKGGFFANGPPTLMDVVAIPLLCNDYGKSFKLSCKAYANNDKSTREILTPSKRR